jgi:hypothetical protein
MIVVSVVARLSELRCGMLRCCITTPEWVRALLVIGYFREPQTMQLFYREE